MVITISEALLMSVASFVFASMGLMSLTTFEQMNPDFSQDIH